MKKEKEISAWARALYLAIEENPEKQEELINGLIKFLDKKQYLLPAIFKKYERMKKQENSVEIFLAREMDDDTKKKIEKKVESILGKDKKIEYKINKELIAGFRIKTKEYLVKASIKDTLTKLKNNVYGYN